MERTEKTLSVSELLDHMRENNLVIAHRSLVKLPQDKVLRKKSLTYKEIADSDLWDVSSKSRVEAIAKEECEDHEIFRKGNANRVHISAVLRIMKKRGL